MNQRDFEKAIQREVSEWPGATVEFAAGGKHPKAKLRANDLLLSVTFPSTTSDGFRALHNTIADVRRALKKMGAERPKPTPTKEEDEAPYRKPNDGADKRPDPVAGEKAAIKPTVADKLVKVGVITAEVRDGEVVAETVRIAGKSAEALREEDGEAEARRAELQAQVEAIVDGIYFNLPEAIYHAVPRLSASGLQKLCVSPATFWRGSWLDPDKPPLDEEQTKAQVLGKAYHCARLEPERFHDTYVRAISKADYPAKGLLTSDAAIKAALKELGATQSIGTETIAERGQRLLDEGYAGTVLAVEQAKWEAERNDRIPLPAEYFDQIVTDMTRIKNTTAIANLLSNGQPEVSIFWTDKHGLKMKSRVDWLGRTAQTDFKTFDNSRGKALDQALADAVRFNRLHVQAATYRDASEAVRTGGIDIVGEATDEQRDLVYSLRTRAKPLRFWFVFQEKGGVPNLLAREFRFQAVTGYRETEIDALVEEDGRESVREALGGTTMLYSRALWEIDRAKRAFVEYSQVYEPGEPWFPIDPIGAFDDLAFNSYWLEGKA